MAKNRQLDHDLVELFINDNIYQKYLDQVDSGKSKEPAH